VVHSAASYSRSAPIRRSHREYQLNSRVQRLKLTEPIAADDATLAIPKDQTNAIYIVLIGLQNLEPGKAIVESSRSNIRPTTFP
jgi:hypothetical protein